MTTKNIDNNKRQICELILELLLSSNENRILQAEMIALTNDIDIVKLIAHKQYDKIGIYKPLDFMITELKYEHHHLYSLPPLPQGLIYLNVNNNNLKKLPKLPNKLERLECRFNNLPFLPELPSSLRYLDCSQNWLKNIPTMPESLEYINFTGNGYLKTINFSKGLKTIIGGFYSLDSFPALPEGLVTLKCPFSKRADLPDVLPSSLMNLNFSTI